MRVGDLVKFRTTMCKNIGIVVRIAPSAHLEHGILYHVHWNESMGDGAYWKHELEVVSESR